MQTTDYSSRARDVADVLLDSHFRVVHRATLLQSALLAGTQAFLSPILNYFFFKTRKFALRAAVSSFEPAFRTQPT
ncbi:unnamed protein product [Caenorhabditis auriculariae]|uniref:Uncharacterized protein n=1 Tax=Caenorhabditis auriculariae TaxID=2777116 RepID=A0A8S1GWQ2_9PELO|nr:unnamed protein product [Caenorhabditis auriculariae]